MRQPAETESEGWRSGQAYFGGWDIRCPRLTEEKISRKALVGRVEAKDSVAWCNLGVAFGNG